MFAVVVLCLRKMPEGCVVGTSYNSTIKKPWNGTNAGPRFVIQYITPGTYPAQTIGANTSFCSNKTGYYKLFIPTTYWNPYEITVRWLVDEKEVERMYWTGKINKGQCVDISMTVAFGGGYTNEQVYLYESMEGTEQKVIDRWFYICPTPTPTATQSSRFSEEFVMGSRRNNYLDYLMGFLAQ